MNLWIRSQKREGLFNFDRLWYYYDEEENKHCLCNYEFEFGTYKTKERALEVLDEIQRLITDLQYMSYAISNNKFTGYRPNVYEMPKE